MRPDCPACALSVRASLDSPFIVARDGEAATPPGVLGGDIGWRNPAKKRANPLSVAGTFAGVRRGHGCALYWVTAMQSKPLPFSLAHTACVSCAVANGPIRTR
jgi:hypothetical protein